MKTYLITDYGAVPDKEELQTEALQRVFDLCLGEGGTVVFPKGRFRTGGLLMHSDTTVLLEEGAVLIGSDDCEDYPVWDVPEGVSLRTDMEMITHYYNDRPWKEYRRAILSAYGEKNVSILGSSSSVINGSDCFDGAGEEGFRGPHGIFLSNCENVTLRGYTIERTGNFMHQLDACSHVRMENVTCVAGHDGIHLHCCTDTRIDGCVFHTGDDCIAGINIRDLTVSECELNTSCDVFRIGGIGILVQNCRIWGPGIYPHRMTVVKGKNDVLPDSEGRHNLICLMVYFSSETYPVPSAHDIVFRNCTVENAGTFLLYDYGSHTLQTGTPLTGIGLENVTFTGLESPSWVHTKEGVPLVIGLKNVKTSFVPGAPDTRFLIPANGDVVIRED